MRGWLHTLLILAFPFAPAGAQTATEPSPASVERTDPVQEAVATARKKRTYVWVVVCGADHADDCDAFREGTLNDAEVRAWMEHRVTLLPLDPDKPQGQSFVSARGIETLPTVVILASDGRELGRVTGNVAPKKFLRMANAVIQSAAIRAEPGVMQGWAGEDVVLHIMDHARDLTEQKKYEEALKEYTWCLDHRATRSPLFPVTHLETLMRGVVSLAKVYEPAMNALTRRLAAAEVESAKHARPNVDALYLLKYGYIALDEEDKLVAHYDRLKSRWPKGDAAPAFARLIYRPLLHARRYEELRHTVSDPGDVGLYLLEARQNSVDKAKTREVLAGRYEILLGLGMMRQAADLAQQMIAYDRCAETYLEMADAALRSTNSTDDNIEQARWAYDLTGGENVRSVLVYARLLAQRNAQDPQAQQVLKAALAHFQSDADKVALTQCLYDIQAGKVPPRRTVVGEPEP